MKKNLMFLALASLGLGLASCNGGFKQADGGLLYNIVSTKGGAVIQPGDFISLNLVAKTDGDSVLFSTYESGREIQMAAQKPQSKGDIFTGLEKLAEGDSAVIKIPADSMFKKGQQKPPGFKGKYLVYNIKIEKVIAKGNLSEAVFNGRVTDYIKTQGLVLKKAEPAKIQFYITHQHLNVTKTADSLNYVITQQGTGPKPEVGDTVVVNYTGRLLSGKVFDTSIKDTAVKEKMPVDPMRQYKPIHIPVGQKRVIAGWDEGLLLLNKGSKATLVVPSSLAYGERGVSIISPFTPIAFDVEIVDIIKPNPNAVKPMQMPVPPVQAPVKR
jgi:FKBP-type peptidyl-prolyl cis-trans isomerase FkpA